MLSSSLPSSSSDSESDSGSGGDSQVSSVETCGEDCQQLETTPPPDTYARHSSLRETPGTALSPRGPEESKAMHGEQGTWAQRPGLAASQEALGSAVGTRHWG